MIIQLLRYVRHALLVNPSSVMRIVVLLVAMLAYGTTGFLFFELSENPDLGWSDGLWYTIVTMTTVGYGDFFPKTTAGRFLVGWPVMFFGIGILGYALSLIAAALVTEKAKELKGMTTLSLTGHLVIFNYPGITMIERVLEELRLDASFGRERQVVLVDEDLAELPEELQRLHIRFVRGNPTRDETLRRASIDHASHAIILSRNPGDSASDNLNVSITLAIEGRSRRVNTVVECIDPATEELLRKAGCDRIVCTSRFGANFMSQELLNPGVQELVHDLLSSKEGQQIYFIPLERSPALFGDVAAACARQGHLALGVSGSGGTRINPPADSSLGAGDRVITVGPRRINSLSV